MAKVAQPEVVETLEPGWVRISHDGKNFHDCPREAFDEVYSKNEEAGWKILGISGADAQSSADLNSLTKAELSSLATERGVVVDANATKADIVAALDAADQGEVA
jgi:hypothetical protein